MQLPLLLRVPVPGDGGHRAGAFGGGRDGVQFVFLFFAHFHPSSALACGETVTKMQHFLCLFLGVRRDTLQV